MEAAIKYINQKQWRQRRLENGYCKACGKNKVDEGKSLCAGCKEKKQLDKIKPTHEQIIALGFDFEVDGREPDCYTMYWKPISIKIDNKIVDADARIFFKGTIKKHDDSAYYIMYNDCGSEISLNIRSAFEFEMALKILGH